MALELFDDQGIPFFYGEGLGQPAKYLNFFRQELIPTMQQDEGQSLIYSDPIYPSRGANAQPQF